MTDDRKAFENSRIYKTFERMGESYIDSDTHIAWQNWQDALEYARQVPPASVVVDVSELILLVDDLLFKQSRLGPCVEPDERDAAKEVLLQAIRVLASHLKLASDICAGWKLRHDSKCTELAKSRIKFLEELRDNVTEEMAIDGFLVLPTTESNSTIAAAKKVFHAMLNAKVTELK